MKIKLLTAALLSTLALSANVNAKPTQGNTYLQVGVSNMDFEVKNRFKSENFTYISVGGGYNITDNVAFQITGYLPISSETQYKIVDTYRDIISDNGAINSESDLSDVIVEEYDSTFESRGMITADFKLTIPVHNRVSLFAKAGYTYASFKTKLYDFTVDNLPQGFDPALSVCQLTGIESQCNNEFTFKRTSISESSVSYGIGVAMHLAKNKTFLLSYNRYLERDDISSRGVQFNYEWVF